MDDVERSLTKAHGMIASLAKSLAEHREALADAHRRLDMHTARMSKMQEQLTHHGDQHELHKSEARSIHKTLGEHSSRLGKLEGAGKPDTRVAPIRRPSPSQERGFAKTFTDNARRGVL